jgi:hypothetical protein
MHATREALLLVVADGEAETPLLLHMHAAPSMTPTIETLQLPIKQHCR